MDFDEKMMVAAVRDEIRADCHSFQEKIRADYGSFRTEMRGETLDIARRLDKHILGTYKAWGNATLAAFLLVDVVIITLVVAKAIYQH